MGIDRLAGMRLPLIAGTLLALSGPAHCDPGEDEAHRLDRLETKALNEQASRRLADRPSRVPIAPAPAPVQPPKTVRAATAGEEALRAEEEKAVQAWRREQARCRDHPPKRGC